MNAGNSKSLEKRHVINDHSNVIYINVCLIFQCSSMLRGGITLSTAVDKAGSVFNRLSPSPYVSELNDSATLQEIAFLFMELFYRA